MRNLLAFVAALVLTLAGVGLYLGWFQVRTTAPNAGKRTVNIEVNTDKIGDDLREGGEYLLQEGGEKLHEILEKHQKENATPHAENTLSGPTKQPPNQ